MSFGALFLSLLTQGVWQSCAHLLLYMEWKDAGWESTLLQFLIAAVAQTLQCVHIGLPCCHLSQAGNWEGHE